MVVPERDPSDYRWWLIILLFYPAYNLLMAGAALLFRITSDPLELITAERLFDPAAVVLHVAIAV